MKPTPKTRASGPSKSGKHHAASEPAGPAAFGKRTITPLAFISEVASIAAAAPTFNKIWIRRELDPRFRELLMLAVARSNDSKYCSWAHHEWALIEGVAEKKLLKVERVQDSEFGRRTHLALRFARELVAARFGPVAKELSQQMQAHYTVDEIEEIAFVAKVMDVANVSSNTFDALLSRLGGRPSNGRIVDEAIMSAAFLCALPPILIYFSRATKRPVSAVVRRMLDYTRGMEARHMAAAQPRSQLAKARKRPSRANVKRKRTLKQSVQPRYAAKG